MGRLRVFPLLLLLAAGCRPGRLVDNPHPFHVVARMETTAGVASLYDDGGAWFRCARWSGCGDADDGDAGEAGETGEEVSTAGCGCDAWDLVGSHPLIIRFNRAYLSAGTRLTTAGGQVTLLYSGAEGAGWVELSRAETESADSGWWSSFYSDYWLNIGGAFEATFSGFGLKRGLFYPLPTEVAGVAK